MNFRLGHRRTVLRVRIFIWDTEEPARVFEIPFGTQENRLACSKFLLGHGRTVSRVRNSVWDTEEPSCVLEIPFSVQGTPFYRTKIKTDVTLYSKDRGVASVFALFNCSDLSVPVGYRVLGLFV